MIRTIPTEAREQLYCKNCKHMRPWPHWSIYLIPFVGQVIFFVSYFSPDRYRLGACAASPKNVDNYIGVPEEAVFADISRKYGPCFPDAKLYEARK